MPNVYSVWFRKAGSVETNRRPDMRKPPDPLPFCDDKLPDIDIVSLVVIGASIDCDIDIPDTSIVGNPLSLLVEKNNNKQTFQNCTQFGVTWFKTHSNSSSYGLNISVALTFIVILPFGLVRCCSFLSARSRANCSYSSRISLGVFVRCTISQPSVCKPFTPSES